MMVLWGEDLGAWLDSEKRVMTIYEKTCRSSFVLPAKWRYSKKVSLINLNIVPCKMMKLPLPWFRTSHFFELWKNYWPLFINSPVFLIVQQWPSNRGCHIIFKYFNTCPRTWLELWTHIFQLDVSDFRVTRQVPVCSRECKGQASLGLSFLQSDQWIVSAIKTYTVMMNGVFTEYTLWKCVYVYAYMCECSGKGTENVH